MVSHQGTGTSSKLKPQTGGVKDHRAKPLVLPCQDVSTFDCIQDMCAFLLKNLIKTFIHCHFCLLPASRTASSFTKIKDIRRTSNTASKQDTDQDESDVRSAEVPEEPTTTPQPRPAAPARRIRPLSQTRSFHSIFSSLRGSVRNTANRGTSRGRAQHREDEEDVEEEEEEIPTTPPPIAETTTMEVILDTKAPENNVPPESEDDLGYDEEPLTTKAPSLKVLIPSSTKASARPNELPRRPFKIRVHQKPGAKGSSSSSSSSSPSTTSVSTSSKIPESPASKEDYVAFTYPESKNTHDKLRRTYTKPSPPVVKDTSQQTEATSTGKGSASTGRTNGSGFGSRHGYSRRHPGTLLRRNSTRTPNDYKPAVTSQSNMPRTPNRATSNTHGSATSQSTLPDSSTQNHKTSHPYDSSTSGSPSQRETHIQEKSDSYNFDKSHSTSLQTTQSASNHPSTINTSGSPQLRHTQSSHTPSDQGTTIREGNDDNYFKNTDAKEPKVEEPTSSSKPQPTEQVKREEQDREESSNKKPVLARTRISPSFAERFPWLASRYPGRFGSGTRGSSSRQDGRAPSTRTLSSTGASTPILRGTTTRISGATGAAGVPKIQETSEGLRTPSTPDSLKNEAGVGSLKPSLTNQNTAANDPRNAATSSSSTSSSSATTSSKSNFYPPSNGQGESQEPIHRETSNDNKNDHDKDYLNERSREDSGKNDKVADPTSAPKNPTKMSSDPHGNVEENHSMATSRTRSGSTSQSVRPSARGNGRIHPSLLANRHFGGSRLSTRTQLGEDSRLGASASHSSSSSADSLSSKEKQPVVPSDRSIGSGSSVTRISSSRDSFRGQGGRTRYPGLRGKPTNGGQPKQGNGNGKVHCIVYVHKTSCHS